MNSITIDFSHSKGRISPNIYGHFAEHIGGVIYDGLWVGEDSAIDNIRGFRKALVESFRRIHPPVLRWPGGCFAETYDWRDGIGPRERRPRRVNWWYHCDGKIETNQVGTHEFIDFCHMVGAEPYIAANMTSTTPLNIRNWIEYCNFPSGLTTFADERASNGAPEPFGVRYWGIGNENWGGGGQMSPEMCAREFIRYTTVFKSLGVNDLKFILCGANAGDTEWTRRIMQEWSNRKWQETPTYGMSLHYYTNALSGSDAFLFDEDGWYDEIFRAAYMRQILEKHRAAMDEFDPQRQIKLVVDEWGNWHKDGSGPSAGGNLFEQQSSMRDAVVTALTLNIFNNACDVMDMANVAQLCNNLHSLYLASGEHFVETPNYHVFDLFKDHQGGKQLALIVDSELLERENFSAMESISASASIRDGRLTLTMANLSLTESKRVQLNALGGSFSGNARIAVLAHADPNACNTFEAPHTVTPKESAIFLSAGDAVLLPPASVTRICLPLENHVGK